MKKEDMEMLKLLLEEYQNKESPGDWLRHNINWVIYSIEIHPTMTKGHKHE